MQALQMKHLILGGINEDQMLFQKECNRPELEVDVVFPVEASSNSLWSTTDCENSSLIFHPNLRIWGQSY